MLVETIRRKTGIRVHVATMSRALKSIGARRGRPKPTVACPWSKRAKNNRLRKIDRLVESVPVDEMIFYENEVDIHLNPKIGLDWMVRGHQKVVLTPGQNQKRYLAGALDAETGELICVEGESKNSKILLGGPTPGSGGGSHSQINDSATISLLEDSILSILPWSNYKPNQADDLEIITWQDSLEGQFSEVMIDPWFDANDIEFFWYYDNVSGPGGLVLVRGRAGDPDFNDDDNIDHEDLEIWEQSFGTEQGPMFGDADLDGDTDGYDFLIWQVQYRPERQQTAQS